MTTPAKLINKLTRSRLHEEIVTMIQHKIIRGDIRPGDKLPTERVLAETLDVNRSTVREALRKLETQELVEIRHGDGVYARDYRDSGNLDLIKTMIYMDNRLDEKVLMDLLLFRRIFVPEMAAVAARNRTEEDIRAIEEIIFNTPEITILERDLRLHHAIARASRNIIYTIVLNFFNKMFRDFGYLYFDNPDNCQHSEKFHRDIYEAIKGGNNRKAHKIMVEVLKYAEDQIHSTIEELKPAIRQEK